MTKAAIYLRVSSKDGRQDEANQEPETLRLCEARGWEPVWFRERESGVKERPEWRAVVECARRGDVAAVVFWDVDRIGRNKNQVTHDLRELFRWKVTVVSVRQSWLDCSAEMGPVRDLLVDVVSWVAQGEREKLIARTRAGLARAKLLGKKLGRPRTIDGATLARARELCEAGERPARIARTLEAEGLGSHLPQSIRTVLMRAGYKDKLYGSRVYGAHGPDKLTW